MTEPSTKPTGVLSGKPALIIGAIGVVLTTAAPFIPAPWGMWGGLVGFTAAALAGMSVAPPKVMAGKPVLQGSALVAALTGAGLLNEFWSMIPPGWPQSVALAAAGALTLLTGKALPQLGGAEPPPAPAPVETVKGAADVFNGKGPQP